MDVLIAGDAKAAAELESALRQLGLHVALSDPPGSLADGLVAIEGTIEADRPRLAVGVGTADGALALAITAPKLSVPFRAWLSDATVERPDERRILETLSPADLPALQGDSDGAALEIATGLSGEPPDLDLESAS